MKLNKSFAVAMMVLVFGTALFMGCSDNSSDNNTPGDNNTPTVLFSDLSGEEQAGLAETLVEETIYSIVDMKSAVNDIASGNFYGIGFTMGSFTELNPKIQAPKTIMAPPDTSWTGPDADGFYSTSMSYSESGQTFTMAYQVKFTPDIWDDAHADEPVTGGAVKYSYEISGGTEGDMSMNGEYAFTLNEARTHLDGSMNFSLSYSGSDPTMDAAEYAYTASWQNVALDNEDYQGQYSFGFDLNVLGMDETNNLANYVIGFDSDFDFQTSGLGTGSTSVNDIESIRYSFNAVNAPDPRTGFYTLKSEDFSVQHPFSIDAN